MTVLLLLATLAACRRSHPTPPPTAVDAAADGVVVPGLDAAAGQPGQDAPDDVPLPEADAAPDLEPDDASPPDAPDPPDAMVDLPPPPPPRVLISEVMYHPVLEDAYEDQHEFIELHNPGALPVDLTGWKLGGDVTFTLPAGSTIAAHGFAVIAKNRTALAAVAGYGLVAASLLGDYQGQLDNGGGLVSLVRPDGVAADSFRYQDTFPWPIAADALGAGEAWLPAGLLPLASHRHRGVSLERVSYDLPATAVSNWVPSAVDAASPGRANAVSGLPPAIVETLSVTTASGQPAIGSADPVQVRLGLSAHGPVQAVTVEYFVDDLERTDEPRLSIAATPAAASAQELQAMLPPHPERSIVRYRIVGDRGRGPEVLSPRPTDPFAWHAYFVSPASAPAQPPYQLFIKSTDWGQLWTNIVAAGSDDSRVIAEVVNGRTARCRIRDSWDARVPAVFVWQGQVYDVRVRYQGSRWNRDGGDAIDLTRTTIAPLPVPMFPGPDAAGSLRALSWNIDFPRYRRLTGGRDGISLNKLGQACPGLDATIGEQLYHSAGIPSTRAQYRRLHVNGGHYGYMLDLEPPDEQLLARYLPPGTRLGDLFKASGNDGGEEGPWGPSDEQPLPTSCADTATPYPPLTRYGYTYERKTWEWKDASDIQMLIEGLHAARMQSRLDDADPGNDDLAPVRAYLASTFDLPATLTYLAIRNWSQPWDDVVHNHYLYKNDKGLWSLLPWDLDQEFSERHGWDAKRSFFIGERWDADNRSQSWNRVKDSFLRAYRPEFLARLGQLIGQLPATTPGDPSHGLLSVARWQPMVEAAAARFDPAEWAASPVTNRCDFVAEKTKLMAFAEARNAAAVDVLACRDRVCGLKGEYFRGLTFDPAALAFSRNDRVVDFNWGGAAPVGPAAFPADDFQIRWTGKITPPNTGTYTLYVKSDDGVRLWVGGFLVIDDWNGHPATENQATVPLFAGIPLDIRLEYFEGIVEASVSLSWSGPGVPKQVIPGRHLTPAP